MCFWVAREDYFKLEKYVKKFEKSLHSPLPFTAYRKMMGVSREFYSWDSHNGVQAELICLYLRHIEKEEDIEILDLYSLYIQAWNGELPDDHYMTQHYKESNAQELLILVETLDILLGNGGSREDNLLLNGDEALWHALGSAKNWYQVEKRLQESA